MKIIEPQDLVPEPSKVAEKLRDIVDAIVIKHFEDMIKGKRVLTGDGRGKRKTVR